MVCSRTDAVRPFAKYHSGLQLALEDFNELNLTAKTRRNINGVQNYIYKFECILKASPLRSKILNAFDDRNNQLFRQETLQ